MNGNAIIIGAVLIIIGIIMVSVTRPIKSDHETPEGKIEKTFNDGAEQEYQRVVFIMWCGILTSIVGMLIIGITLIQAYEEKISKVVKRLSLPSLKGIEFVIGAVLIIIGFVIAANYHSLKSDHETSDGKLMRAYDDDAEHEYQMAVFKMWCGILTSVIGAIVITLFAIVAHSRAGPPTGPPPPRQSLKELLQAQKESSFAQKSILKPGSIPANAPICHCCRHLVNKSWETCPNCGAHLEQLVFLCPIGSIRDIRKE